MRDAAPGDHPVQRAGPDDLVGAGLVRWAFTTTHMDHYQPLSWLTWGAVARIFGLEPHHFHALSLLTHALVVALIYLTAVRLMDRRGVPENRARIGAAIAALVFGVHPLRVEPVAWASAFPYLAALACALLATLAYETSRAWAAVAFFAVSLLFRPIAFGLPLVLMALDRFPRRERLGGGRTRSGAVPIHMVPFFALAIAGVGLRYLFELNVERRVVSELTVDLNDLIGATAFAADGHLEVREYGHHGGVKDAFKRYLTEALRAAGVPRHRER